MTELMSCRLCGNRPHVREDDDEYRVCQEEELGCICSWTDAIWETEELAIQWWNKLQQGIEMKVREVVEACIGLTLKT